MGTEPASELPPHVLDYLAGHETLTLATASPVGVPRATTLTYVNDGPVLYVWTRPETTTARHIERNPLVSFAIDEYSPEWRATKGIQGAGECRVVLAPGEIERAVALFEQKYPVLAGALDAAVSFFRISPTELQFIDNAAGDAAAPTVFHRQPVFSVFWDLPEEEIESVSTGMQRLEIEAGQVVVRQGAPADKFFVIVDGEVEVVREDEGERRVLATLGPGQFFGEIAILRDRPRMATVRTLKPTTVFAMESDTFRSLIAQSIGTTQNFDEVVDRRLAELGAGEPR